LGGGEGGGGGGGGGGDNTQGLTFVALLRVTVPPDYKEGEKEKKSYTKGCSTVRLAVLCSRVCPSFGNSRRKRGEKGGKKKRGVRTAMSLCLASATETAIIGALSTRPQRRRRLLSVFKEVTKKEEGSGGGCLRDGRPTLGGLCIQETREPLFFPYSGLCEKKGMKKKEKGKGR